jgi:hypothetical protein
MEMTFTNPFEIVTDNVIFGMDTIKAAAAGRVRRQVDDFEDVELEAVRIPKYNNYMKKVIATLVNVEIF